MRYVLPSKSKKSNREASSRSSGQLMTQATTAPGVTKLLDRSRFVITPPPKRKRAGEPQGPLVVEGSSRGSWRLDKGESAEVAANLEVLPTPKEPLVMLGSKTNDPQFLVSDVIDHNLNEVLHLYPHFNLPIQVIYKHFNHDS